MAKVSFNTDMCKGCGLCVDACPKKCLAIAGDKLNQKGYSPAYVQDRPLKIHFFQVRDTIFFLTDEK